MNSLIALLPAVATLPRHPSLRPIHDLNYIPQDFTPSLRAHSIDFLLLMGGIWKSFPHLQTLFQCLSLNGDKGWHLPIAF